MTTARATELDYASYFVHPHVQIVVNIGTGKSEAVPYKNHSTSVGPKPKIFFGSGFGVKDGGQINEEVSWRFVEKSEYGDLYLFAVTNRGKLVKAFPALYDGLSVFTYSFDDIRVKIEPHSGGD